MDKIKIKTEVIDKNNLPFAVRDKDENMTGNPIITWDSTNKKLVTNKVGTEEWTFKLDDGTIISKSVVIK